MLKCIISYCIDKGTMAQNGLSMLWCAIYSSNIDAVSYLLDLGVVIPTLTPDVCEIHCRRCQEKKLIIDTDDVLDPCVLAITDNNLEMVKLLDKHGGQSFKLFYYLRKAVMNRRVEVASYLLKKYTYPMNIEYTLEESYQSRYNLEHTLLTELHFNFNARDTLVPIIKLLLEHGADPAKRMCSARRANAIMTAIDDGHTSAIVQYIRSGVDINVSSYHRLYKVVLPFEASVMRGYQNLAEILLISGCSCGVFSLSNNHTFKDDIKPEMEKLMKDWKVQENNVIPLKQRCRSVILNHLSPQAHIEIEKLPLPPLMIKILSIPELDGGIQKSHN